MSGIISTRAVARSLGLSETALRKAERAGRIARDMDGSWDLAKVREGLAVKSPPRGGRPPKQPRTPPWARPAEGLASANPEIRGSALSIHAELEVARRALERAARQIAALYPEVLRFDAARDAAIAAQERVSE
jgi:hypothetical protein